MSEEPSSEPVIELTRISKDFPGGVRGLIDVSLTVRRGEFVAIVGPSGAGKSTLLNVIGLLDVPDSGEYRISGRDVSELRERQRDQLRSHTFGFVFQAAHIIDFDSVARNAFLPLAIQGVGAKAAAPIVSSALADVGLTQRGGALARTLSGGERQRLAIARALAAGPGVILADEPTGNLDSGNGEAIMRLLEASNARGTTVVLITHDERLAERASRVVRIEDGRISTDVRRRAPAVMADAVARPTGEARGSRAVRVLSPLLEAVNSISLRPWRAFALMFAFLLGVAGLVAASGLTSTASQQVADQLSTAGMSRLSAYLPTGTSRADQLAVTEAVKRLDHVRAVGVTKSLDAVRADVSLLPPGFVSNQPDFAGHAQTADTAFLEMSRVVTAPRSGLAALNADAAGARALVGASVARDLGIAGAGPGVDIWVQKHRYNVVGIITSASADSGLTRAVVVPAVDAPSGQPEVVVQTDPGYPAQVAEAVPYVIAPDNPGSVLTSTVADLRGLRVGVANDLGALLTGISAVVLVMAVLSAAATMYLSVQSRTREIALRRALGASRRGITGLFLVEGGALGLAGGLAGTAVGIVVVVAVSALRNWTAVTSFEVIPLGVGAGLVTGFVAAAVPAFMASRIAPAEAIR